LRLGEVTFPFPRASSIQGFRHEDVMAGNLEGHIGSKRSGADFEVAEVAVKGRERCARAHDAEVDGPATCFAEIALGDIHHFATEPGSLTQWVHAKQAQVAAVTAEFDIDAGREGRGISSDEEFAFCHVGANAFGVDAIAFDEGLLDAESGIDQTNERFGIGRECRTNLNPLGRTSVCCITIEDIPALLEMVHPRLV
jgi:hypothetical protein